MNIDIENVRAKRRFLTWLKEAEGHCDSTVLNVEKSINLYEEFTKGANFKAFNPDKAKAFKDWLIKRQFRGKLIAITTYYSYVKNLRKFFLWLSGQTGYKNKIRPDMVGYLKVTDKEERIATQATIRNYPPIEYVIKLANSILGDSEIDKRDRALIAFTLLSGMRDKAIVTLPLMCFDEVAFKIDQNPRQGVDTKYSKYIPSNIYKFDDKLLGYVTEWVKYLKSKSFGSQAPLFPRSKKEQGRDNLSFEKSLKVEPIFWQSAGRMREIFKTRAKEAGLPYYAPHTFRHLAVNLALKHCKTGEEIKAVSQNFGHEHVATTLSSYGNYTPDRLSEIINKMNFSGKPLKAYDTKLEEIKKILLDS